MPFRGTCSGGYEGAVTREIDQRTTTPNFLHSKGQCLAGADYVSFYVIRTFCFWDRGQPLETCSTSRLDPCSPPPLCFLGRHILFCEDSGPPTQILDSPLQGQTLCGKLDASTDHFLPCRVGWALFCFLQTSSQLVRSWETWGLHTRSDWSHGTDSRISGRPVEWQILTVFTSSTKTLLDSKRMYCHSEMRIRWYVPKERENRENFSVKTDRQVWRHKVFVKTTSECTVVLWSLVPFGSMQTKSAGHALVSYVQTREFEFEFLSLTVRLYWTS